MTTPTKSLFEQFYQRGEKELIHVRRILQKTNKTFAEPKTWGIQQAAALIGRSAPWLREHDPDAPKNEQGFPQWDLARINQIRERVKRRPSRPKGAALPVIAFHNMKGGVGKTTCCSHFAHAAAIEGYRVLAIDFDPQGSLSHLLARLSPEVDLGEEDVPLAAFLKAPDTLQRYVRGTSFTNVSLIPCSPIMQELDIALPNPQLSNAATLGSSALRLKKGLSQSFFEDNFDLVVIDCPPNMGSLTVNAMMAATGFIMPIRPGALDRAAFVVMCQSFATFFEMVDRSLDYVKILITQHEGSSDDVYNESRLRALFGEHVLGHVFHQSKEIAKAASQLSTVYQLNKPINSRDTWKRALDTANGVNQEILKDLTAQWRKA